MATETDEIWIGEDDTRRQLKGAELEDFLADRAATRLEMEERVAQAQTKAAARKAVLNRLGITEEEAQAIFG